MDIKSPITAPAEGIISEKEQKGPRSFFAYVRNGNEFEPTGSIMHCRTPGAAARKIAIRLSRETGVTKGLEIVVRTSYKKRLRTYAADIYPDITIEPNSTHNRAVGVKEVIGAGLIERNQYYLNHPLNPKTKTPWTAEDAKIRNARLVKSTTGFIDKQSGKPYPTTIQLNEGEHTVLRAKAAKVKLISGQNMPAGTKLRPDTKGGEVPPQFKAALEAKKNKTAPNRKVKQEKK
jgi:hypothetical protein